MHNILSTLGAVNTTASTLASCPDLENLGDWDLELEINDHFKTDKEVNRHVRQNMHEEQAPDVEEQAPDVEKLRTGRCISIYLVVRLRSL